MWELLDEALAEQAEIGLEVGDFGMDFGCIISCFLNGLEVEGFLEGLWYNCVSDEADSSGDYGRPVVLVNGEGVDDFLD